MALQRRTAAVAAPTGVNFGSLDMYVAGGGLPEGDYVFSDLSVQMYQAQTQAGVARGPARLGVMITLIPLSDPREENARTQFYSMGGSADKSFAPNPETGKGIVPVPGGPGTTLNNGTNWALLLKSLYDCGLPEGIFSNDVSVLEGTHVHIINVPEPEERRGFVNKNATGEAPMEERKNATVAIVSEIKDDGKPWENTGGIPEAPVAAAPKAGVKVMPKPRVNGAVKPVAAPAPAAAPSGDEDVEVAAITAVSSFIEKNPNGMSRLLLKTGTFKAVKDAQGDDMASAVTETYFANDDVLNALLGQFGYSIQGAMIKPAA